MYKVQEETFPSDLDIYNFYLPNFKVGEMMLSPLRKEDTPSFNVFKTGKGKLVWKDFGSSSSSGSAVDLVMCLYGLTYNGARRKIQQDLSGQTLFLGLPCKHIVSEVRPATEIKIKIRPFSKNDLDYWASFGITKQILDKFQVFSISHYWKNGQIRFINKNQLAFAYYFGNDKFKIYRPNDGKLYKWRNNCDETVIQGYNQLNKFGDLLVITKALKDVMTLYNYGISAIAPQAESIVFKREVIDSLFERFTNIVTLFDNDKTGFDLAEKYYNQYGIYSLFIPQNCCAKDISDYYKNNGDVETVELLKHLNLC